MSIHTTDAIVLRQYAYRETSLLVTCISDRFGKLKGLIKGLRNDLVRYRSRMDLLTLNRIVFYDHRNSSLHLISQCELLEAYPELPADLDAMRVAASCGELIDALVEVDEPQPAIFELLQRTLTRITRRSDDLLALRGHFILRLLRLVGFQPQLDECTGCGRDLADAQGFWSVRQGGVLCEGCLHEDPHAHPIDEGMIRLLSACSRSDEPLPLARPHAEAIHRRVDEFLRWRVERPLKAMGHHGAPSTHHRSPGRQDRTRDAAAMSRWSSSHPGDRRHPAFTPVSA